MQTQNALNCHNRSVYKKMMKLGVETGILDEIGTFLLYIGCKEWISIGRTNFLRPQNMEQNRLDPCRGQILSKVEIDIVVTN